MADGTANGLVNSGRKHKNVKKESEESIGSIVEPGNDVNAVVSGETRKGGGAGHCNTTTAISGIGAGGGTTTNGKTSMGENGVGGETGYTRANSEEIDIRGRGGYGRSE